MFEEDEAGFVDQEASLLQPTWIVFPNVIYSRARPDRLFSYGAVKRGFDLIASAVLLVILSPLFLIVAIIIKLDSSGPVFFRQTRTGKNGEEFEILKFRSMVRDNDMRDTSCEDKYTRVGGWLRKTSIDELPQLLNVFCGQMSFIGPRPWVPEYWENMNEYERGRCMVRPGMTGLAAAKGRNGLSVFEKINYDLEYVRNYSLKMDMRVAFLTIWQVFRKEEADAGKMQLRSDIESLRKRDKK